MYSKDDINQIKERVNIVDVVRAAVPGLKRKGRDWWACCPFHHEKSPSFSVREDQGYYHCFGCGAHGDVFTFVEETRGGGFNEAVEHLATLAGITLKKEKRDPAAEKKRADGMQALARAEIFYRKNLAEPAIGYLKNRGLTGVTAKEFGLGWVEDAWTPLSSALLAENFTPEVLLSAGLTIESDKGNYDRFRGRLMFPIHNLKGEPVGFGGRVIGEGEPKYLNSPETPFFHKSQTLYNLHRARDEMRKTNQAILVEGYMDVIGLWQHGVKTAVAPLGTAITPEQIKLLWRFHPAPVVCLDGDTAGRTAAARVAQRALEVISPGFTLNFVWMPEKEDPDSFVTKHGKEAFEKLLSSPTGLEDVLWQSVVANNNITTGDGRAAVEAATSQLVRQIADATVKKHYAQALKDRLWQAGRTKNSQKTVAPKNWVPQVNTFGPTQHLLAILLAYPALLPKVEEEFSTIQYPNPQEKALQGILFKSLTEKGVEKEDVDSYLLGTDLEELAQNLRNMCHQFSDIHQAAAQWKILIEEVSARQTARLQAQHALDALREEI